MRLRCARARLSRRVSPTYIEPMLHVFARSASVSVWRRAAAECVRPIADASWRHPCDRRPIINKSWPHPDPPLRRGHPASCDSHDTSDQSPSCAASPAVRCGPAPACATHSAALHRQAPGLIPPALPSSAAALHCDILTIRPTNHRLVLPPLPSGVGKRPRAPPALQHCIGRRLGWSHPPCSTASAGAPVGPARPAALHLQAPGLIVPAMLTSAAAPHCGIHMKRLTNHRLVLPPLPSSAGKRPRALSALLCCTGRRPLAPPAPLCSMARRPRAPPAPLCSMGGRPRAPPAPLCSIDGRPRAPTVPLCSIGRRPRAPLAPLCSMGRRQSVPTALQRCIGTHSRAPPPQPRGMRGRPRPPPAPLCCTGRRQRAPPALACCMGRRSRAPHRTRAAHVDREGGVPGSRCGAHFPVPARFSSVVGSRCARPGNS
jgi:hypothetical protein